MQAWERIGRNGFVVCSHRLHAEPGFGGLCSPKDTVALLRTGLDHDAPLCIVEAVEAVMRHGLAYESVGRARKTTKAK
jgi:UDP-glucose 6-dehydrogenase